MTERMLKVLPLGVFGSLLVALVAVNTAPAQEPIPLRAPGAPQPDPVPLPLPTPGQKEGLAAQPGQGDGIEVLAKGPVHEAFASTAEAPVAAPVVAKQPPEPIEELPPDQKPEGDNVQWIPGYWSWDEESGQFIWVSGFWRQPPPGRVWVPGAWRDAKGGWQYVPGFWQEVAPVQPQQQGQPVQPQAQPEIEYLPQPPQSLEVGPTVAAPGATSVYVPGSWVWRGRYVWRPGVWVDYRANWVWVPARYHWSPAGYVFCDGYWDYPLATRGVLFAPVAFSRPVYVRPAFVYTPVYVVSEPCMTGALFVRRGHGHYYFGDYFEPRYIDRGYSAWCGTVTRNGFSIGFSAGRTWGYDPLWSYYSVHYRSTPRWNAGVADIYAGRYRGDVVRPPATLVQQNTVINKITQTNVNNVTNNITVVNGAPTVGNQNVANVAMVAPLKVAPDLQRTKFQAVAADQRREEATAARQLRDVAAQRTRLETAVASKPQPAPTPGANSATRPAATPQSIKLDVPKAAVARARVANDDKAPPPNPLRGNGSPSAGAKVEPRPGVGGPGNPSAPAQPRPPVTSSVNPSINPTPKVEPKQPINPTVNPPAKTEPRQPANPATNPQPTAPKVEPRPAPVMNPAPKVEPKQPVNPAVNPQPKVNPTPAPVPTKPAVPPPATNPAPKVEPRPPVPSTPAPRVEPKPVTTPPATTPARPAPQPNPAPKVEPRPTPTPSRPAPASVPSPPPATPKASTPPPAPVTQPRPQPAAPAPSRPVTPTAPAAPPVQPRPQPAPAPVQPSRPVTIQSPPPARPAATPPTAPSRPAPKSQPPAGKPGKRSNE